MDHGKDKDMDETKRFDQIEEDNDSETASQSGTEPREGVAPSADSPASQVVPSSRYGVTHDVAIHTDPRVWSLGSMAHCSCGWQGPYRMDKRNAEDDRRAHHG